MTICLDIGIVCTHVSLGRFQIFVQVRSEYIAAKRCGRDSACILLVYCDHVIFWVVIWPLCIHCIRAVNGPLRRTSVPIPLLLTLFYHPLVKASIKEKAPVGTFSLSGYCETHEGLLTSLLCIQYTLCIPAAWNEI